MIPVGLILLLSVALIVGVLVFAARGQDRVANEASIHLGRSVLADKNRALANLAVDSSYWDQAVDNLVTTLDRDWADANIGTYMNETYAVTSTFVVDAQNRLIYAMVDGVGTSDDPFDRLTGGIEEMAARARASEPTEPPVGITGLLKDGAEIHFTAISEFKDYEDEDGILITMPTGALLILTTRIDDVLLAELSENYLLDELQFTPFGSPVHFDVNLPVATPDGTPAGTLSWNMTSPGRAMLQQVLPGIGVSFLVLAALTFLILSRGQRMVDAALREMDSRRRAEEQVVQLQKVQSLGHLAGGMAHNLNNLIYPILVLSGRTRDELPAGTRGRERLDKVVDAGERARDLVGNILEFSHKGDAQENSIDVQDSVHSALGLLRPTMPTNVVLKEQVDAVAGAVRAHPAQIGVIVMNLVSNAADALRGTTGEVTVSLTFAEVDAPMAGSVANLEPGRFARLTVKDTGEGMTEETQRQIFDPFFTTKDVGAGTGLGLSSVFGIVSNLGGTLDVHSALHVGTTIDVYFPLAPDETASLGPGPVDAIAVA